MGLQSFAYDLQTQVPPGYIPINVPVQSYAPSISSHISQGSVHRLSNVFIPGYERSNRLELPNPASSSRQIGWSGGAKVLCILHQRGVQLILAYSWARPAILVAGKGRGGMFLFLLFLHFHSCSSFFPVPLFYLFYCLFYLFSPFLWETTQNDPQGLTCR